ncbi:protein kinase family protein [Alloscardovia criceti]|uniref:hypothetical protein n=1 Tax=Alloscardovia criceti TaxID=356828 RepID=UPI00037CE122|nr:hypothetical protein [Alloscardovia criceti]
MNFAIGDVLLDRFRLVEVLRDEPGFSVWIARDNTLQRRCQIFIVANSTIISRVNAAASALALSQDKHFVQVLHLHRDGEVCVIVTDEDTGVTLRDYLTDHAADPQAFPLSHDAIRSITGDLTSLCQKLDDNGQAHYCIDDINVRLAHRHIVMANFPVSAALLPPTAPRFKSTNHDVESVMVYQIAALAFEMLTGTPYRSVLAGRARGMLLEAHTPEDLMLICVRGLCLPDEKNETPVPLVTLFELNILLNPYQSLSELSKKDNSHINLSHRPRSVPSISQAVLKRVDPQYIAPIPRSLKEKPADSDSTAIPDWSASELIFGGAKAVDLTKPDTSTDLFHALGELDETKLEKHYDPYDFNDFPDADFSTVNMNTQAIRQAATAASTSADSAVAASESANKPASTDQDRIPTGSFRSRSAHPAPASRANVSRETLSEAGTETEVIPPVFAPRASQTSRNRAATPAQQPEKTQNSPKTQPQKKNSVFSTLLEKVGTILQTRTGSIIGIAIILIALLIGSIYSLGLGSFSSTDSPNDPWSQISKETVRFPGQENNKGADSSTLAESSTDDSQENSSSSDNSSSSTNSDNQTQSTTTTPTTSDSDITPVSLPESKAVSAVPTPEGTGSTTVIEPLGYTFLNRPDGIRGWGYSFTFSEATHFWKVEVGNQTGGGQVHIYADPTTENPTTGNEVASFSFADNAQTTSIILRKPVTATKLVVWIDGTDASTIPQSIRLTHYAFY